MSQILEAPDMEAYRRKQRLGLSVALWLAVLTVIEYLIAVFVTDPLIWLLPFVLAKGWLIMKYFMHFRDLFGEEH